MARPVVLVSKGGSIFYTRDALTKASAAGEQGETEGLLRHLASPEISSWLDVIYFGQWRGSEIPGVPVIEPKIDGIDEWADADLQEEYHAYDEQRLRDLIGNRRAIGHIQVAGYSPTMSFIRNPRFNTVQAASSRLQAPPLAAMNRLKLPRLIVNNDPRTYPKDMEMSYEDIWPWARPRALLDQWNHETTQVVGGVKYLRRSRMSRAESWGYLERFDNYGTVPCKVVAHAHLTDSIKQPGRAVAWHIVLDHALDKLPGLTVHGKGWESYQHFKRYPEVFMGQAKVKDVPGILSQACVTPVVGHKPGFYTGKPYVAMASGCLPLFFGGEGCESLYTADPLGLIVPLNHPLRIRHHDDLTCLARSAYLVGWEDYRALLSEKLKPDFSKLDQMLVDLADGRDVDSESWYADYGGYRRIG